MWLHWTVKSRVLPRDMIYHVLPRPSRCTWERSQVEYAGSFWDGKVIVCEGHSESTLHKSYPSDWECRLGYVANDWLCIPPQTSLSDQCTWRIVNVAGSYRLVHDDQVYHYTRTDHVGALSSTTFEFERERHCRIKHLSLNILCSQEMASCIEVLLNLTIVVRLKRLIHTNIQYKRGKVEQWTYCSTKAMVR